MRGLCCQTEMEQKVREKEAEKVFRASSDCGPHLRLRFWSSLQRQLHAQTPLPPSSPEGSQGPRVTRTSSLPASHCLWFHLPAQFFTLQVLLPLSQSLLLQGRPHPQCRFLKETQDDVPETHGDIRVPLRVRSRRPQM